MELIAGIAAANDAFSAMEVIAEFEREVSAKALRWAARHSEDYYWPESTLDALADGVAAGELEVS